MRSGAEHLPTQHIQTKSETTSLSHYLAKLTTVETILLQISFLLLRIAIANQLATPSQINEDEQRNSLQKTQFEKRRGSKIPDPTRYSSPSQRDQSVAQPWQPEGCFG
jgi:hypothetical protein